MCDCFMRFGGGADAGAGKGRWLGVNCVVLGEEIGEGVDQSSDGEEI